MIDGDRRSDAQQDAPDNAMRSGSEGTRATPPPSPGFNAIPGENVEPNAVFSSDDEEEPPSSSSNAILGENVDPNADSEEVLEIIYEPGSNGSQGNIRFTVGDVYEGELKDGEPHGRGICHYENGDVYDGEFKEGEKYGRGTYTWPSGAVYVGEYENDERHGAGTFTWADGTVYVGEYENDERHGEGTFTWADGSVNDGEWKGGKMHGKGTVKFTSDDIYEGVWRDGEKESKGKMTWANGDIQKGCFEWPSGRLLRSQRSQQHRLKKNVAIHVCENCGVDDQNYKLRVCSGCNLALYCSLDCQWRARGSHRRICNIISELPARDADRLVLKYDKDKMVDLDGGLRYGTKYLGDLKHLTIYVKGKASGDTIKLSTKQLSSLLRSKKGGLDSFCWLANSGDIQVPDISQNGHAVWRELCGLKQLQLESMKFDDVQPVCDIIGQQRYTLMVLCLPRLLVHWHRAKCRRTIAVAVSACKYLVKLDLTGCLLMDSDLKVLLNDLPSLRILHLERHPVNAHEFTDNSCGLIARKCPGLQELNLDNHNHLSVRGIRKIFGGCPHLRVFYTSSLKLRSEDVRNLLDIAPQLMYLSLDESLVAGEELDEIIEATGGRTLIQFNDVGDCQIYDPKGVSAETRETYGRQIELGREVIRRSDDPEVTNEWEGIL